MGFLSWLNEHGAISGGNDTHQANSRRFLKMIWPFKAMHSGSGRPVAFRSAFRPRSSDCRCRDFAAHGGARTKGHIAKSSLRIVRPEPFRHPASRKRGNQPDALLAHQNRRGAQGENREGDWVRHPRANPRPAGSKEKDESPSLEKVCRCWTHAIGEHASPSLILAKKFGNAVEVTADLTFGTS